MSVDLEKLEAEITAIGEEIKQLKSSAGDKGAIDSAVKALLAAKKAYADSNNGIGVDGKPYEEHLSKAEKKAKAKAEKAAKAGEAKPQGDPSSINAQKKAAKKAEKAAKKAAHKQGGDAAPGQQQKQQPQEKQESPSQQQKSDSVVKPVAAVPPSAYASRLQPLQVAINPNVPLTQRPVVAMSVAVLTDTTLDLSLYSDHRSRHTAMGLEECGGGVVTGDFAIARYLLRRCGAASHKSTSLLPIQDTAKEAVVNAWIDYAQSLSLLPVQQRLNAVTLTLEHALVENTYLVGHSLTLADICLFASAGFPTQATDLKTVLKNMPEGAIHARRWIRMMAAHPALQEATQLCIGIANNAEAVFDENCQLEPLVPGMNILEGAVAGRVVTRFPPEPSGYLHIGHAKAVLLNDYYARRYKGRLIVRFDDTNPSKEKEEYQESIVADLAKLGVKPDLVTYTSDYFEAISSYAKALIAKGMAFMDDTPQEQMKAERAERIESKHRNQTPEEALKYFELMCSGKPEGSIWCLRAKIDMNSDNGTLRDPVLFRQNLETHHRCGNKYKAFPTYDLACPIVDSLEGVTHALRTTEYNDRDEQYQWILKSIGLRRVRIHAFSRVNFKNTLLSKRKLTWFVDNNYVTGWDDARMPTVRGVVRRGINILALRNFMYSQGASRRVVLMDWHVFWSENKKELDKTAKRFMAIDKQNHVKLTVTNGPKEEDYHFAEVAVHPKDSSLGKRVVRLSSRVLLEKVDVEGIKVGEPIVLLNWGVVNITNVDADSLSGVYVPDGDYKTPERKLSWLSDVSTNCRVILTEVDNLVSKDKLDEEDNFMDFINPETMAETEVIGDACLKNLQEHEVIQLVRRGYFRVDRPYISDNKPLILFMIPDGKAKCMSGMTGKLAHR